MKIVKIIITIILLILGFAYQCEVFHQEIWNFDTGHYLSSSITFESEEERIHLLKDLYQCAQNEGVDIFAVNIRMVNDIQYELHIFGDDTIKDVIYEKNGIKEQKYTSVFSGSTDVKFHDFFDLEDYENRYITDISYIGEEENIYKLHEQLYKEYKITSPYIDNSTEKDMIYVIWVLVAAVLLVMNCVLIVFTKKEVVVRVSFGESVWRIILKSSFEEIVTDVTLFLVVRKIVFCCISGEFMKNTVMYIYALGIILSCLCYCSYSFYDIKAAFSNVNDSKLILKFTYGLKALATAFSIVVIVTNTSTIMKDIFVLNEPSVREEFREYSYIRIRDLNPNRLEEEMHQYYEDIYLEYYEHTNPCICSRFLVDDDNHLEYIYVNEYAASMLNDFVSDLEYDKSADVIYFIPEESDNEVTREDAKYCLQQTLKNTDGLRIEVVTYSGTKSMSYFDTDSSVGIVSSVNPVVIFSKYKGCENLDNLCLQNYDTNVMYRLSDEMLSSMRTQFHLNIEAGYELMKMGLMESYEYRNNILRKTIAFCSSICFFTLILQFVLIITINRMEYRLNAMELALKRVLGYSLWKKNSKIMISSIVLNIVTMLILIKVGQVLGLFGAGTCLLVGSIIMVLEVLVIVINIFIIEAKNIQKILKGGCL